MSQAHLIPSSLPQAVYGGVCPRCNGAAYRIHRRPCDRFFSIFLPVHRYRCGSMGCDWEGNLLAAQAVPKK